MKSSHLNEVSLIAFIKDFQIVYCSFVHQAIKNYTYCPYKNQHQIKGEYPTDKIDRRLV